jgi:hypothetical protein
LSEAGKPDEDSTEALLQKANQAADVRFGPAVTHSRTIGWSCPRNQNPGSTERAPDEGTENEATGARHKSALVDVYR